MSKYAILYSLENISNIFIMIGSITPVPGTHPMGAIGAPVEQNAQSQVSYPESCLGPDSTTGLQFSACQVLGLQLLDC